MAKQKQKAKNAAELKSREDIKKPVSLDAKAKQKQKAERVKHQKIEAELETVLKQLDQLSRPEVKNTEN